MIGYIKGTISHLFPEYCFVDVQGVGYRIFIPYTTREKLNLGVQTSLYTYLNVREDALMLFGFYTQQEYDLFMHLISVTGIGPKVAVNILSNVQPNEFYLSISQKRLDFLTKIPGIGKKTAERIILELKDKINIETSPDDIEKGVLAKDSAKIKADPFAMVFEDAVAALIVLGYGQGEAASAIKKITVENKDYSTQQLIKLALKDLKG